MLFADRKYVSGTSWCVFRWSITDSDYIRRLHLIKTPLFAVCLHWLRKPDPEPYHHDHPVSFLSVVLRGWYDEIRQRGRDAVPARRRRQWFNWISASADDRHTIVEVAPGTLTLALMGPKTREWGFHRPDEVKLADRWIWWKEYYRLQRLEKTRGES